MRNGDSGAHAVSVVRAVASIGSSSKEAPASIRRRCRLIARGFVGCGTDGGREGIKGPSDDGREGHVSEHVDDELAQPKREAALRLRATYGSKSI